MKRILSILLALLMIMCFVGCKEPETDFNDVTKPATKPTTKPETKPETTPSEPDSVDDELILSIPELPKSEGTDPFLGLTELVINQPNNYDYIKVDSENNFIHPDHGGSLRCTRIDRKTARGHNKTYNARMGKPDSRHGVLTDEMSAYPWTRYPGIQLTEQHIRFCETRIHR